MEAIALGVQAIPCDAPFIDPVRTRSGTWDEELMCYVEPAIPKCRIRNFAGGLREDVCARNVARAVGRAHEITRGASVVYAPEERGQHGNFIDASYRRILAREEWRLRLRKAHSGKRQAQPNGPDEEVREWRELDAATSSDALLMNVFCYPSVMNRRLCSLLSVDSKDVAEFGYKPRIPVARRLTDCSEIDMKLGSLLVEAKLTEGDFGWGAPRLCDRYLAFRDVFDRELLYTDQRRGVESYQVVRGILAAAHLNTRYCLLFDERRSDLRERWFNVVRAVRSFELQSRLCLVTWQEVARVLPQSLRLFLEHKYGIIS